MKFNHTDTSIVAKTLLLAALANAVVVLGSLSYMQSVVFVMGSIALHGIGYMNQGRIAKTITKTEVVLVSGFVVFSNIMTLGLEFLMLKFDVWGFSSRKYNLLGPTLLGAPLEEFVYWALCPVIVAVYYLVMARSAVKPISKQSKYVTKLGIWLETLKVAKAIPAQAASTPQIDYVKPDSEFRYQRGTKFPTYVLVQIAIVSAILVMLKYYHGSKRAMFGTTLVFTATAWPHELYSTYCGFWVYNSQRLVGLELWRIPIEGYLMYIISPICGCMMIDLAARKFIGKDV